MAACVATGWLGQPTLVASRRSSFVGPAVAHTSARPCLRRHSGAGRQVAVQPTRAVAAPPQEASGSGPAAAAKGQAGGAPVDFFAEWWPIAYVKDIPEKAPYAFTLLEQPIVIWRDNEGKYRCFRDACPHRLVPLSDGRIAPNGQLECPYHGWQFSGCGTCSSMPQGGDPSAPRASATAYQCTVVQDMVWVKLQPAPADGSEPDTSAIPTLPELDEPGWFAFGDMWRDIPYDWATLIENVVDAGHVPFTHHGSVSKRQSSGDFGDMSVTNRSDGGFSGVWATGPRKGALGAQLTQWRGPVLMRHTIDAYDTRGFANITAVYGVPIAPGRCRAIVRQPFRFKNKVVPLLFKLMPAFMGHLGNNSVLDEDVIFLHMQEQEAVRRGMGAKPAGQVYFMPAASDAYVAAFRNWLDRSAGGGPWGPMSAQYLQRAGPRKSETELLDHYHSHTEKCSVCRPALANIQTANTITAAVGIAAAAVAAMALIVQLGTTGSLLPAATAAAAGKAAKQAAAAASQGSLPPLVSLAAGCAVLAFVAFLAWRWCQKTLPRFFSGQRPFSRNRVPGEFGA